MKTDCKDLGPRLSAYLDGELPERERQELERHLKTCPSCRQLIHELNEAADALKTAYSGAAEPGVDLTGLWETIEKQAGFGPTIWQRLRALVDRPVVWLPATAAIALLIFVMPAQKAEEPLKPSRVESVFSQTGQVMLLQTANSCSPIIWVLPKAQKEVGS